MSKLIYDGMVPRPIPFKVVLLMLTFNHEDTVTSAIESLITQRYKDFELIIVDDSSTDSTVSVIEAFADRDSRIRVIKNPKNLGMFQNFEVNLLRVKTEKKFDFFAWVGPDDVWSTEWLAALIESFIHYPSSGVYQSYSKYIYSNSSEIRKYKNFKDESLSYGKSITLREGYGQLIHGLWTHNTVCQILKYSNAMPIKYLLRLENFFVALLISTSGFSVVPEVLHTKQKSAGSKYRYIDIDYFQQPGANLLPMCLSFPAFLRLLSLNRKKIGFLFGAWLIDLRICFPRRVRH